MLVLIAFAVAGLAPASGRHDRAPAVADLARHRRGGPAAAADAEQLRVYELLRTSAEAVAAPVEGPEARGRSAFEAARPRRLAVIAAQRSALLDARDDGTFDAEVLASVLAALDATEIGIELRARAQG